MHAYLKRQIEALRADGLREEIPFYMLLYCDNIRLGIEVVFVGRLDERNTKLEQNNK